MAEENEPLTDEQLVSLVNQEFEQALGSPGGEIGLERAEALDYYLQKQFGNEIEGQSKAVTSDVADVVDGIMPSLMRIFTTADNLVDFDPVSDEDKPVAEQESDYVNYIFFKRNPAFEILFFWTFDALLQKIGIVKSWWDESEEITTETYEGLSEEELFELLSDDDVEVKERSERQAETVDPDTQQIVMATVHDVQFRRVTKSRRIRVENVPPEEYRISNDARSLDPSRAKMVGHERDVTRDELLAMGFDKEVVNELQASDNPLDSTEKVARRDKVDDQRASKKSPDRSQDKIRLREAYIKVDDDGDGRSELMQVFVAVGHDKPLSKEPIDRQPFHVIASSPLPHKHFGRATGEKVMDVQLVGSTLLRQILDNLYHTNRPGHIISETHSNENTMDDLLTTDVGRNVRVRGDARAAAAPIVVPFTAGESFPILQYYDKVKRDRTGISSDSEGLTPEALKNIQQSVMAEANDLSRMKIELIARIFAETGFKSLFLHIHELTRKHQKKADYVRLRNEFVPVDPRSWKHRWDMTVNIGLGIGTRDRNLVHLEAIWQKLKDMGDAGLMGVTFTPKHVWNTFSEIVKNARLMRPEMYGKDPGDAQAPPPNQEQIALQKQQQQLVQRQQQLDAEEQRQDRAKLQLQAQEQRLKHEREMAELRRKTESDQDKLTIEFEKLRNQIFEIEAKFQTDLPEPQQ